MSNLTERETNEALPKLLRAIASGSAARENRHDIILNAAADEIERRRRAANSHQELIEALDELILDASDHVPKTTLKRARAALARARGEAS